MVISILILSTLISRTFCRGLFLAISQPPERCRYASTSEPNGSISAPQLLQYTVPFGIGREHRGQDPVTTIVCLWILSGTHPPRSRRYICHSIYPSRILLLAPCPHALQSQSSAEQHVTQSPSRGPPINCSRMSIYQICGTVSKSTAGTARTVALPSFIVTTQP